MVPSLGLKAKHESLDNIENVPLLSTSEITQMKNDIVEVCEQLEIITLIEIFTISHMLDKISLSKHFLPKNFEFFDI